METRTINVYKFSELSEKAKDRARYDYAGSGDWDRAGEYLASIRALAEHFGGWVIDYSIDWTNSTAPSRMKFFMPDDMSPAEIWTRLLALGDFDRKTLRGHGECKLTGVCYDEAAIDGFREAFVSGRESDLDALMQSAFRSWVRCAWVDYERDMSDEGMAEMADANDWRYTEDGRIFRGS